jgi:hypothetical protein
LVEAIEVTMAFLFFTLESRACEMLSSMTVLSRPTYSDERVVLGKQLSEIQQKVATVGVGQDGHTMRQQRAWARWLLRCQTSRIQKCFAAPCAQCVTSKSRTLDIGLQWSRRH